VTTFVCAVRLLEALNLSRMPTNAGVRALYIQLANYYYELIVDRLDEI